MGLADLKAQVKGVLRILRRSNVNHAPSFRFSNDWFRAAVVRAAVACILAGASCVSAFGQALTSLSGTVSDASGAVAPNVTVLIEDATRNYTMRRKPKIRVC